MVRNDESTILITPIGDSILLTPLMSKQKLIDNDEEDPSVVNEINEGDESLQTAEDVIFRPLFAYRVLLEQKKRRQSRRLYESSTTKIVEKTTQKLEEENSAETESKFYTPQVTPPLFYDIPFYYYNGEYYPVLE